MQKAGGGGWIAVLATLSVCAVGASATAGVQDKTAPPPVSFNREILPILSTNCFACHGPDEKTRETKFHFDTQDGLMRSAAAIARVVSPASKRATARSRRSSE